MRKNFCYLDYNATTPVDKRVVDAMLPFFNTQFGNPASRHDSGQSARRFVEQARAQAAESINAERPDEIVFTSCATESINLALQGFVAGLDRTHLITVKTEHKAVLDTCKALASQGIAITRLDVRRDGKIDLAQLESKIRPRQTIVSVMTANNEIGTIQDVRAIGEICRDRQAIFHTDATQAVGKIAFDVRAMNVDLASFSAHKFYGPKGVGALYVRDELKPLGTAQLRGGGHEFGSRSGTLNVPGIVGLGRALQLCDQTLACEAKRLANLRNALADGLQRNLTGVQINGTLSDCLPNTLNVSFEAVDAESLMLELDDVALSSGSACSSSSKAPSHVLMALYGDEEIAKSSVRFSLGRFTNESEVDLVLHRCIEAVRWLRDVSPRYAPSVSSSQDNLAVPASPLTEAS